MTYTKISLDEFREAMDGQPVQFTERTPDWTKEYIFDREFNDTDSGNEFVLRVYSSIDQRSDEGREKGKDAIRAVLLYQHPDKEEKHWSPLFKEKRTHRTPGWDRRLTEKIESLLDKFSEIKYCPRCGRVMVVRKNKSEGNLFYGCTGWRPEDALCKNTEPYGDD